MPRRRGPGRLRLVTLSSDFGWAYAAQMKAEIYRRAPDATVVDLAHDLPRHGIAEAAFVVRAMAGRFPPGAVHTVVVDPGVGGARAPLAVACADGSFLVGPDNGVLAPLAERLGAPVAVRLDPARVAPGPRVGTTFDGRDLFAPAAALLACGVPLERLGEPHRMELGSGFPAEPRRRPGGADGAVAHVDHFGNVISNVPGEWVPARIRAVAVGRPGRPSVVVPWGSSYEGFGRGRVGALVSSFGTVEIAVAGGSAARRLRLPAGRPLRLAWRTATGARATETVNSGRSVRR